MGVDIMYNEQASLWINEIVLMTEFGATSDKELLELWYLSLTKNYIL